MLRRLCDATSADRPLLGCRAPDSMSRSSAGDSTTVPSSVSNLTPSSRASTDASTTMPSDSRLPLLGCTTW